MIHLEKAEAEFMGFISGFDGHGLSEYAELAFLEEGCKIYIELHKDRGISIFSSDAPNLVLYYLARR